MVDAAPNLKSQYLTVNEKIGEGAFGVVRKGEYLFTPVAIKKKDVPVCHKGGACHSQHQFTAPCTVPLLPEPDAPDAMSTAPLTPVRPTAPLTPVRPLLPVDRVA